MCEFINLQTKNSQLRELTVIGWGKWALNDHIGYKYNWSYVRGEPGIPTTTYQAKPVQDIWNQKGWMEICLPCFPVFALSWYNKTRVHHDSVSSPVIGDVKGAKTAYLEIWWV